MLDVQIEYNRCGPWTCQKRPRRRRMLQRRSVQLQPLWPPRKLLPLPVLLSRQALVMPPGILSVPSALYMAAVCILPFQADCNSKAAAVLQKLTRSTNFRASAP